MSEEEIKKEIDRLTNLLISENKQPVANITTDKSGPKIAGRVDVKTVIRIMEQVDKEYGKCENYIITKPMFEISNTDMPDGNFPYQHVNINNTKNNEKNI